MMKKIWKRQLCIICVLILLIQPLYVNASQSKSGNFSTSYVLSRIQTAKANTLADAEQYNIGQTVTNSNSEYLNYYKFTINQRKTIQISFTGYAQNNLCRLYLYDKNFDELDCESPAGFWVDGAKTVTKKYTLDKGTYYFAVNDNDTALQKYEFKISYVNTKTLYNYMGYSQQTAKNIKVGESVSALIRGAYSNCNHYYKIKLTEKSQLLLKFKWYNTTGDDLTVNIYNSSLKKLDSFNITANYEMTTAYNYQKTFTKGTYYVCLYYGYNTVNGYQYDMSLKQKCLTPKLSTYSKGKKVIKGSTSPKSKISIKVNKKTYKCTSNKKGNFTVKLNKKLNAKDKIVVSVTKSGYAKSDTKKYVVK